MSQVGDTEDEPSLEDTIPQAIRSAVASVRTVIPGRILAYDHSEQRAKVRPVIRSSRLNPDTSERETYLPQAIPDCPVRFPQGDEFSMTWPLKKGDIVQLTVASRSMADWLEGGGQDVTPRSLRRHSINDIVVEPGLRSFTNALADDRIDVGALVLACGNKEIHLGKAGASEFIALANLVEQEIEDIRSKLNAFITKYNGHNHQGEVAKSPNPASKADAVGSVASSNVKST